MATILSNWLDSLYRAALLVYGVATYIVFLATFLYAIGFVGNFGVEKTIDGTPSGSPLAALGLNLLLLAVFALQHSVMARPKFKKVWTTLVPPEVERSTYVLFSSIALLVVFMFWEPVGGVVWQAENPATKAVLFGGFALGWGLVLISTFAINHFDLLGLRQVWLAFRSQSYTAPKFVTPRLYRIVRHPLYVGWLFAFWCTSTMTVTHLFFAVVTTAYILVAVRLEERDLMAAHPQYESYRNKVPMLIPNLLAKRPWRREVAAA